MALSNISRRRWTSGLHLLVRFLGLTGLVAAGLGLGVALIENLLPRWHPALRFDKNLFDILCALLECWPGYLVLVGGALALLAVIVEVVVVSRVVAGRRSAFGLNALAQVMLAIVLLLGVNLYSSRHFWRFDWTRDQRFTLDKDIQRQLSDLKDEPKTTIVVYQRHKTFGALSEKPDRYDYAAERKVVEKVKDLVEQFREFGPQFRIVVLDVEQEDFDSELAKLKEQSPELVQAIDRAPENSIFFQAGDRVQSLSFNDFYQLDKTSSQEANDGRGNLVLRFQGVEPFARRVLNIEEKKPRVAIAVTHELLTSEGAAEEYTLAGLKKVLRERGFDTRDLILKKWTRRAPPEPAVYTYDESKFERLADRIEVISAQLRFFEKQHEAWKAMSKKEMDKRGLDDEERKIQVQNWGSLVEQGSKQRNLAVADQQRLQVESLAEQRRLTDLKAKMDRALADCDLLILPRMTLRNVTLPPFNVPNEVHRLDETQVAAIKDFLKAGKPVLACFGPVNESPDERPFPSSGPDGLEDMLASLGLKLGKQTVLFDREIGTLAEYQAALQGRRDLDLMSRGDDSDVPPLMLERVKPVKSSDADRLPNPIRESLRLTARSLGKDQGLALRARHPRPVTFEPAVGKSAGVEAEFLLTDPESWTEDQPFPTEKYLPRYEDSKKRGPVSVAAGVEVPLPADWYSKDDARPEQTTVRVAAIGHGSLFVGPTLSPAREKLLLDSCNWLLGRDDQLAQEGTTWSLPRVDVSSREQLLWAWGTMLGLPGLFTYLGLVVLLVRRLR